MAADAVVRDVVFTVLCDGNGMKLARVLEMSITVRLR